VCPADFTQPLDARTFRCRLENVNEETFTLQDVANAKHATITNFGVICCVVAARDRFLETLRMELLSQADSKNNKFKWQNVAKNGVQTPLCSRLFCLCDLLFVLWGCMTASDAPLCLNNLSQDSRAPTKFMVRWIEDFIKYGVGIEHQRVTQTATKVRDWWNGGTTYGQGSKTANTKQREDDARARYKALGEHMADCNEFSSFKVTAQLCGFTASRERSSSHPSASVDAPPPSTTGSPEHTRVSIPLSTPRNSSVPAPGALDDDAANVELTPPLSGNNARATPSALPTPPAQLPKTNDKTQLTEAPEQSSATARGATRQPTTPSMCGRNSRGGDVSPVDPNLEKQSDYANEIDNMSPRTFNALDGALAAAEATAKAAWNVVTAPR
jgi:hypothetical protein